MNVAQMIAELRASGIRTQADRGLAIMERIEMNDEDYINRIRDMGDSAEAMRDDAKAAEAGSPESTALLVGAYGSLNAMGICERLDIIIKLLESK